MIPHDGPEQLEATQWKLCAIEDVYCACSLQRSSVKDFQGFPSVFGWTQSFELLIESCSFWDRQVGDVQHHGVHQYFVFGFLNVPF